MRNPKLFTYIDSYWLDIDAIEYITDQGKVCTVGLRSGEQLNLQCPAKQVLAACEAAVAQYYGRTEPQTEANP